MAINRDVEVRCEIHILSTEVKDMDDPVGRGGRRGKVETRIVRVPKVIIDNDELIRRATDIADVIQHGYELDPTVPPVVATLPATLITTTGFTLNGNVAGVAAVNTIVGFYFWSTKEIPVPIVADQSPLVNDTPTAISKAAAGLIANTRYYYRAFATGGGLDTRYGRMLSFKTLAL